MLRHTNFGASQAERDTGGIHQVQGATQSVTCYRWNGNHEAKDCRFKTYTCFNCKKQGHIQSACRTRNKPGAEETERKGSGKKEKSRTAVKVMVAENTEPTEDSSSDSDLYSLFHIKGNDVIKVEVAVEQEQLSMKVDTGAAVSVISGEEYNRRLKQHVHLQKDVFGTTYLHRGDH